MKQTTIHARHPEPLAMQKSQASKNQAEFELRETVEEFEKDISAIVKSSVPEAVTWQELLEEMHSDTELSDLKEAIARGYFTAQERRTLGPHYDSIFTELAVVGGLVVGPPRYHQDQGVPANQSVVSRARQNGEGAHPASPPMLSGERVTGVRAVTHDNHAQ